MSLVDYTRRVADQAAAASRLLVRASGQQKNDWLHSSAESVLSSADYLISENSRDLSKSEEYGLTKAEVDRLRLTPQRLESIATGLREVAMLPNPVGEIFESNVRPNGLLVTKVRVPLGVVFFIYESRPNVTADAAALCVKSGNAVILRGGKEALHSNLALHKVLSGNLKSCGLPEYAVQLVETTDREAVGHFLAMSDRIDVTIPRGGKSLIERVTTQATMPVIKHFDGICHVYVDAAADLDMAARILINSKCQRTGVCNAAESVLIHAAVAEEFLGLVAPLLADNHVEVRGDDRVREYIPSAKLATDDDYRTEYLDYIISARVVDSIDEAMDHIAAYGSKHTETIITRDLMAATRFTNEVDSSAVMVNASTRFNDGFEFGLGAEIGISTDKFHARGPCGLRELTSYKYIVHGNGQVRG